MTLQMRSTIIFILIFSSFLAIAPIMGRLAAGRYKESLDRELETETKKTAQLLLRKQLRNKFVVEGIDLVVEYTIYNVGSIAATRVQLKDSSFEDETNFIRVSGFTYVRFGNIPAGGNVSHVIVLRPVNPGIYNFTAAQITYSAGTGEENTVGTSTEPGSAIIHSSVLFHRTYSPHYEEWTAFAVLVLPSLIIPYMLWFASQTKYENLGMLRETEKMRRVLHCRRD